MPIFCVHQASGKYAEVPVNEVVKHSDIGVIARLTDVQKTAGWGVVHATGLLQIEEVLFGDLNPAMPIPIKWTIYEGVIPDGDWSRANTTMIWLTSLKDGVAVNTWAQGILDVSKKGEVLASMEEPLRVKVNRDPAQPWYIATLVYRNLTSSTLEVPMINTRQGQLILPIGTSFIAKTYRRGTDQADLTTASGTVSYTNNPRIVKLNPGQFLEQPVDLSVLYPEGKHEGHIDFRWSMPGMGTSNDAGLYPFVDNSDRYITDMHPLWFKVLILLRYSPSRELIAGLTLGIIALFIFFWGRKPAIEVRA